MENKIVIAATLQFEQDYNLRLSKFENFCVKKIENEINNTGGIGGLKIAINTRFISKKEFEIRGIPEFAKKREQCYQEMKPDIILDVGPQTFQYAPNFFETFKGLVFSNIDPSLNFKHPRFFEMSDELLDNRGSVSFFAKQLLPPAILLVQQSYIATEKTLKAYENSLKTCGWKGNFVSFSLQEEEEQALPEQALPDGTSDQEERIILKILQVFETLPLGALIVLNCTYGYFVQVALNRASNKRKFEVLCLGGFLEEYPFLKIGNLNSDVELLHKLNSYILSGKSKKPKDIDNPETIVSWYSSFVPLFLCQYAANANGRKYDSAKRAVTDLPSIINKLDGDKDTFLHLGYNYSFRNNEVISKSVNAHRRVYLDQINDYEYIFFEKQPSFTKKDYDVLYVYIDLIKVEEINVSDNYWIGDFELEVNSINRDPIDYLKFENRAELINIWNIRKVNEKKLGKRFQTKYRIAGAFDLSAEIGEFPFDTQKLVLEISLDDNLQNQILQSPINSLVDKEFVINGWKFVGATSGTISKKNFDRIGSVLQTKVQVRKINRTEWKVARENKIAVLRSLIPLLVMIILSWYSSFFDFSKALTTVQLNTTVFLAGVALYFSAEKPKGAKFTIIDKLFIYFYIAIAFLILSEFSVLISEEFYLLTHLIWQVAIPTLLAFLLGSLWRKYKSIGKN